MRRMDGIGGGTLGPACEILALEVCDGVVVAMFDRASRGREDRIILVVLSYNCRESCIKKSVKTVNVSENLKLNLSRENVVKSR